MPDLSYRDSSGKASATGNFELELSVTAASSVPLELRAVESSGTLGRPGSGKQVSLRVLPNGDIVAHYFNGNCWTEL